MPINYTQVNGQINQFGKQAAERTPAIRAAVKNALNSLRRHSDQLTNVIEQINEAESMDHTLRCARPVGEVLDHTHSLPEVRSPTTLIAADGSQIIPSRHRQIPFGLINIACIILRTESNDAPTTKTDSNLLSWSDFQTTNSPALQDLISQERDIRERQVLAMEAARCTPPVIALTDGPLELFRETGDKNAYANILSKYRMFLEGMHSHGVIAAGYIDKPQSDMVSRLLTLLSGQQPSNGAPNKSKDRLSWFPDTDLFNEILTTPGDRSAIFGIQSPWNNQLEESLRSGFFYLNVSQTKKPYVVRVELPIWCTHNPIDIDSIHSNIYHQCQIMGTRPYPYILHRAHEVALVTRDETDQLEMMLVGELRSRGLESELPSHKQTAKDLPRRGILP